MNLKLYNRIVDEYQDLRNTHLITDMRIILKKLADKFSKEKRTENEDDLVNEDVIKSIISYRYQQEQKELHRLINWNEIFNDYKNGFGMLSIAATARLSPALVSQRIINHMYSTSQLTQNQIKECQFNSNHIDNCFLAFESMLSHYSDPYYGIHYTQSSNNNGQVFEQQVEIYLKNAGVDFMNEEELRKKKYDVTPDFKLNIPIILERHWQQSAQLSSSMTADTNEHSNSNHQNKRKCIKNYLITKPIEFIPLRNNFNSYESSNHQQPLTLVEGEDKNITREIINWIECKSLFANEQCHKEYVQKQYNSYVNRFGKGIVIYNYGCIDTILDDDRFIVLTRLPELK